MLEEKNEINKTMKYVAWVKYVKKIKWFTCYFFYLSSFKKPFRKTNKKVNESVTDVNKIPFYEARFHEVKFISTS